MIDVPPLGTPDAGAARSTVPAGAENARLRLTRMHIDTYQEPVVYMHRRCPVCRSEGFEAQSRVTIHAASGRHIVATLHVVDGDGLAHDVAALSEAAWRRLAPSPGETARFAHAEAAASASMLRAKVFGERLDAAAFEALMQDVVAGRLSDIELAAFVTACTGERLDIDETIALTRAMVAVGQRLAWPRGPVLDKHCVGGLPGNRTTPIVVAIVAALGYLIPKTSSRAITSPAGTADTMATLAPVDLDIAAMRRVVEREGGCIVWGGAVALSPADDVLIRVERPLDFDSDAQLTASVLSKKIAAGATHVLIDLPVGPTAKVRSLPAAQALAARLVAVGSACGLVVRPLETDGTQPVGRGLGPALEARDVLAVLRGDADAPADLRARAVALAGAVLELDPAGTPGTGAARAEAALADGRAWRKFQAICAAQGGMRELARAPHTHTLAAAAAGRVAAFDNRRLARLAKLAGAPRDATAGLERHVAVGQLVAAGEPLLTLHAETPGELAYALAYYAAQPGIVHVVDAP